MWFGMLLGLLVMAPGLHQPSCEAFSLGAVVHVVPLDKDGGNTVRAHYSVISPLPCPSLSGVCETGADCQVYTTSLPYVGTKPASGWCVRQWQKTVSSNYTANVTLGSSVDVFLSVKAGPFIRANTGRLNQPPYCGLPPPLRARVNCPHHFPLSVKDRDRDKVRCRFAKAELGECLNCIQHNFLKLEEDKCILAYDGSSAAGQYSVQLMVEDFIPVPKTSHDTVDNKALSSVPVHLSLTVEEASSSCSAEPVTAGLTPGGGATIYVLPYEQVDVTLSFRSELESVSEIAVVGPPPDLFRAALQTNGSLATMTITWVRSPNNLTPLLPICFVANTNSLQSEPRCVWFYQRQMDSLPAGTELKCGKTEMTLVLPVSTFKHLNLSELQLNNPSCPVNYNTTHVTAQIPLTGCGTKTVHSHSELVYTNILQSIRPYTTISRMPALVLPLACRIPGREAKGPRYVITIPSEVETFGPVEFWLEFYLPGEGPLADETRFPKFRKLRLAEQERVRRDVPVEQFGKADSLDLHVFSNCSIDRAELMVGKCVESATEDFTTSYPILTQGCVAGNGTLEIITTSSNSKVYRIDIGTLEHEGNTMFVECTVHLCITTMPSQKCPDPCEEKTTNKILIDNLLTRTYTIRSGPVSLLVATATTTTTTPSTPIATTTGIITTTVAVTSSKASEEASAMTVGVVLSLIHMTLQMVLPH